MKIIKYLVVFFCFIQYCMGNENSAREQFQLRLLQSELKLVSPNLQGDILARMKKAQTVSKVVHKYDVDGQISLIDEKGQNIYFKKTTFNFNEINALLKKNSKLKVYIGSFGAPLAKRPDYLGNFFLLNAWNIVLKKEEGKPYEFIRIIGFFKPQENVLAAEFSLVGYIVLGGKSTEI